MDIDLTTECARIAAPTLLLTGEPHLDRVVPVRESMDYLGLVGDIRHVVLTGTGHIGCLSKPRAFAALVDQFLESHAEIGPPARSVASLNEHA
jgi:pimeloyl-ACP methyl ester carboxylesterase